MTKARQLADGTSSALKSATTVVDTTASPAPTAGQLLTATTGSTATWQDAPVSLPSQIGNTGKLLTTDGTTATWQAAPRSTPDFLLINAGII